MTHTTSTSANILLVANWESNVGYAWWLMENFWVTIAEHFSLSDHKSFLIYPKITRTPEQISSANIHVSELNFTDHSPTNLINIYRYIHHHNIRYVYLSDWPSFSFFYLLLRLCGIRKIAVHDHTPGERTPVSGLKKQIKIFIQHLPWITADLSIAVTEFVYHRHLKVNCIPVKKCRIVRNGITPIADIDFKLNYAHNQFAIPKDGKIIVSTGRASYYKGVDFIIECANELINRRKRESVYFIFCGDGPDLDAFIHLRDSYNLQKYFIFPGKRTDIRKILPSCNIGLHASHGEVGYSLSILEYMSAGLATLVPDLPSISQAIEHRQNGIIYQHDSIINACDEIEYCIDSNLQQKLGSVARKNVSERFYIEQTNRMLIDALTPSFYT